MFGDCARFNMVVCQFNCIHTLEIIKLGLGNRFIICNIKNWLIMYFSYSIINFFTFLQNKKEIEEKTLIIIVEGVLVMNDVNEDYYNEIKEYLANNEVYKRVKDYSKNKSDLDTYYNVEKILADAGKHYGEGIIKEYSRKLSFELGKKYSYRTLFRIRQFFLLMSDAKVSQVATQLTWSHWIELLPIKNVAEINYYINICNSLNLSRNELRSRIKSKEYERLPEKTKNKLIKQEEINIKDLVPNPILIENKNNVDVINEKILHQLILENIESFMIELGTGYSFIKSEYKIKLGDKYNYIDLLLFNYEYNCFVVIELKVTELKKEYIGQIEIYMNYIDSKLKKINQDKTIGIIICRRNNKFVIEYCSDKRIIAREYKII